jgi:hypothetical protein
MNVLISVICLRNSSRPAFLKAAFVVWKSIEVFILSTDRAQPQLNTNFRPFPQILVKGFPSQYLQIRDQIL